MIIELVKSFQILLAVIVTMITLFISVGSYTETLKAAQKFTLRKETIGLLQQLASGIEIEQKVAASMLTTLGPDILPMLVEHLRFSHSPEEYGFLSSSIDKIVEDAKCEKLLKSKFDASVFVKTSDWFVKTFYEKDCEKHWSIMVKQVHGRIHEIIDSSLDDLKASGLTDDDKRIEYQIILLKTLETKPILDADASWKDTKNNYLNQRLDILETELLKDDYEKFKELLNDG